MSKAPERIWALLEPEWEDGDGEQFVGGTWDAGRFKEGAQYTRADTAAAQVAAAYERAADWCRDHTMGAVTNPKDAEYCGVYASDEQAHKPLGKHQGMAYAEAIRALATDTQADALELVRKEAALKALADMGQEWDADTAAAQVAAAYERAAIYHDYHASKYCRTGNKVDAAAHDQHAKVIRALATDTQTDALEQVRRDAERAGYERGARLARNMALIEAAGKCDVFDGPVSESEFVNGQSTAAQQIRAAILSLMTPDEQTEAAQELAFRKAVSS